MGSCTSNSAERASAKKSQARFEEGRRLSRGDTKLSESQCHPDCEDNVTCRDKALQDAKLRASSLIAKEAPQAVDDDGGAADAAADHHDTWLFWTELEAYDEKEGVRMAMIFSALEQAVERGYVQEAGAVEKGEWFSRANPGPSVIDQQMSHLLSGDSLVVDTNKYFHELILHGRINAEGAKQLALELKAGKSLMPDTVEELIDMALPLLEAEPNVVRWPAPSQNETLTVVGDIHDSLSNLLEIFENQAGWPSETNKFIFDGDFVDKGKRGCDVMWVLLAFKVALPNSVILLRGNHEDLIQNMCGKDYFRFQCEKRYGKSIYQLLAGDRGVFAYLPLCALVQQTAFVVHGGLMRDGSKGLDDIDRIDRKFHTSLMVDPASYDLARAQEVQDLQDLLWSDPDRAASNWTLNEKRGVGILYTKQMVSSWLSACAVPTMVRGHELTSRMMGKGWDRIMCANETSLYTVFSASDYCGYGNKAAVLRWERSEYSTDDPHDIKLKSYMAPHTCAARELSILSRAEQLGDVITAHAAQLQKAHNQISASESGLVSAAEWCRIMSDGTSVDLPEAQWAQLQPVMAPVDLAAGGIDWFQFLGGYQHSHNLSRNETGANTSSKVAKSLDSIYRHHQLLVKLFRVFDTDNDGFVSETEWITGIRDLLLLLPEKDQKELEGAEGLFHAFDFSGKGKVSINNFLEGARLANDVQSKHVAAIVEQNKPLSQWVTSTGASTGADGGYKSPAVQQMKNRLMRSSSERKKSTDGAAGESL